MSALSDQLEADLLNHVYRGAAYTAPGTVYIALFTAAPGEAGGGTEVTGGSYARQGVATTGWTAPAQESGAAMISNSGVIDFGTATADWGTVVAVGVFSAAVGGTLLHYGNLTTSKVVNTDDQARFNAGALKLRLA